jgi:dienelactone hydrolase
VLLCSAFALAISAAGAGASAGAGSGVVIAVSPTDVLLDAAVHIQISGLRAGEQVTLRASTTSQVGRTWSSSAQFRADGRGDVDPASSPALLGTYLGRDARGLFWSMRPAGWRNPEVTIDFSPPSGPTAVRLAAVVGGHVVATTSFTRRTSDSSVTAHAVTPAVDGIYGRFYSPPGSAPAPGVLLLGGSEGGLSFDATASVLASHGYPALELAYFREPGLPQQLKRIPLEYFQRALEWLASQPGVDPKRIVIVGASRGGEAALLVASTYPSLVRGVVGYGASAVVQPSPDRKSPAWTLGGKPLPHVIKFSPASTNPPEAIIPVEQIAGPVLLLAGDQDLVWPSAPYARVIVQRMHANDKWDVTILVYHGAGHRIGLPDVPLVPRLTGPGGLRPFGGTLEGDAQASQRSWPRVLQFLATLPSS